MNLNSTAAQVAAILNAAYMVRHYCRPRQRQQRTLAIAHMAEASRVALSNLRGNDEAILYAIAQGLYDPSDGRFRV